MITKIGALAATIVIWFPVALMLLTSAAGSSRAGLFRMDYMLPAELFPLVIAGGAVLSLVALRVRLRRGLILGSIAVAVLTLVLSQVLAVVTGLASGATPAGGAAWALVLTLLGIYDLAVVALGIGGVLLIRDLFRQTK